MATLVTELDKIAELAETDEIKELRKRYKEENELIYKDSNIKSFAYILSGICGQNIYIGKEVVMYFEILEMRDFLKDKYVELPNIEALKYKKDIESVLNEADETLKLLEQCM